MQQVGDQFGELGVRQRRADHARGAVLQRRHRVEQVCETAGTGLERGHCVFIAGQRMAQLHAHAARGQHADDVQVPGQLGASVTTFNGAASRYWAISRCVAMAEVAGCAPSLPGLM